MFSCAYNAPFGLGGYRVSVDGFLTTDCHGHGYGHGAITTYIVPYMVPREHVHKVSCIPYIYLTRCKESASWSHVTAHITHRIVLYVCVCAHACIYI